MKIVISSGHGKYIRGASGYLDEVDEARRVVERVAQLLRTLEVGVTTFHDDTSTSQSQNLDTIVAFHNDQNRDLDVSVHFNAYETTSSPMGTEVLYVTQEELASNLSGDLADALRLPNRGGKYRSDLAFLNGTDEPAILIETCFVDSSSDADAYHARFEAACVAIAQTLSGQEITDRPPVPPELPERPPLTEENRVDITGQVHGDVAVLINGQPVMGRERCVNAVVLTIAMTGDVVVTINGQDFHSEES